MSNTRPFTFTTGQKNVCKNQMLKLLHLVRGNGIRTHNLLTVLWLECISNYEALNLFMTMDPERKVST